METFNASMMAINIDIEQICKKAEIFRCIIHRKQAILEIESDEIVIKACCEAFYDHIQYFIDRQFELALEQKGQRE